MFPLPDTEGICRPWNILPEDKSTITMTMNSDEHDRSLQSSQLNWINEFALKDGLFVKTWSNVGSGSN